MKEKIYEKDLYTPVKEYFENNGYVVKSEVKSCDVVAIQGKDIVITELKLSLNLDVILQAVQRQRMTEKVFIAVPIPKKYNSKRFKNICDLLKRLEIGLILVYLKKSVSYVRVELECKNFISNIITTYGKRKRKKLEEEFHLRHGDNNTGGVTREKLITAYRESSLHIAGLIKIHGPLSAKELKTLGADQKAYKIIYNNHYGWFERENKGIYKLTEIGMKELEEYSELINVLINEKGTLDL